LAESLPVGELVVIKESNETLEQVTRMVHAVIDFVEKHPIITISLVADAMEMEPSSTWAHGLINDHFVDCNLTVALQEIACVTEGAAAIQLAIDEGSTIGAALPISPNRVCPTPPPIVTSVGTPFTHSGTNSSNSNSSNSGTAPTSPALPTAVTAGTLIHTLAQTMKAAPSTTYMKVTMDIVPNQPGSKTSAWHHLCKALIMQYGGLEYMGNVKAVQYLRAMLVFYGLATSGTPLHVDLSAAATIAIAVNKEDADVGVILAWWMAIKPSRRVIKRFNDFVTTDPRFKDRFPKRGLAPPSLFDSKGVFVSGGSLDNDLPLLTPDDMAIIKNALMPGDVIVFKQHHGDVARPKPGWIHCVYNIRDSLKFAYDLTPKGKYVNTTLSMVLFASGVYGSLMAEDYTALIAYTWPASC
jgi:hypothetical protein